MFPRLSLRLFLFAMVLVALFASTPLMLAQKAGAVTPPANATVFANLDDSPARDNGNVGWGWCSSCAGGAATATDLWMAQNQTTPALDSGSTEFHIGGPAFSNALFYDKLGANSGFTNFQWDFYFQVDSSVTAAQTYEFDVFQFVGGVNYMFGSQCNYRQGVWNIWNGGNSTWTHTNVRCARFTPGQWNHVTWNLHRTPDQRVHYDSLVVNGTTYSLNIAKPVGLTPAGWGDNLGVQFQLDIAGAPASLQEWVDKVTLTAW